MCLSEGAVGQQITCIGFGVKCFVDAGRLHGVENFAERLAESIKTTDIDPACMHRCEGLKLPDLKDGYVKVSGELKGHLQASEHRAMMQLVPLALLAAVEDVMGAAGHPIVELVCRYNKLNYAVLQACV